MGTAAPAIERSWRGCWGLLCPISRLSWHAHDVDVAASRQSAGGLADRNGQSPTDWKNFKGTLPKGTRRICQFKMDMKIPVKFKQNARKMQVKFKYNSSKILVKL